MTVICFKKNLRGNFPPFSPLQLSLLSHIKLSMSYKGHFSINNTDIIQSEILQNKNFSLYIYKTDIELNS